MPRIWFNKTHLRTILIFVMALTAGCGALKRCAYEGINRDAWQHPEQVIQSLDIQPGNHIADIGSGGGYFTFRLAEAVGPTGNVDAVDVDSEMNEYVAARAQEEGYENIQVILAEPNDPLLPESGVDLIFTCNTYHHLADRANYFARAGKYLRPGGRIAVIEFNGEGWLQQLGGHWTSSDTIQRELKDAGYSLDHEFQFLPKQVFLVFSRHQT